MGHTRQQASAALRQNCLQLLSAAVVLGICCLQPAAALGCTSNALFAPLACGDATAAVQALVGNSSVISISNASFTGYCTGADSQLGVITDFGACHYLGTMAGLSGQGAVVLSTGKARYAASAVYNEETTGDASILNPAAATADPEVAASLVSVGLGSKVNKVYDTATLTFVIESTKSGVLEWQYIMGSAPYVIYIWAGDELDAVVMSVKGPGDDNGTILTSVPGTNTSVAISTVNWVNNNMSYIDNGATKSQFGRQIGTLPIAVPGLTTLLTTQPYIVQAGVPYMVKLVVADVANAQDDTMVWVKSGSLQISSDCVGNWEAAPGATCAQCQKGNGTWQEVYTITRPAFSEGAACEAAAGDTRAANGTYNFPCPSDCEGAWQASAPCNAPCGNGKGMLTERFNVIVQAQGNGTACVIADGALQEVDCTNTEPCPVDCAGDWLQAAACNASCGNGTGFSTEYFNVNVEAQYLGLACNQNNGTLRFLSCNNSQPCPVDCVGAWEMAAAFNASCGNGLGFSTERFNISVPEEICGVPCNATAGQLRLKECNNTTPCPINCQGSWQPAMSCNAPCNNGTGVIAEQFAVTTAAAHNGSHCNVDDGATRLVNCSNPAPCPTCNSMNPGAAWPSQFVCPRGFLFNTANGSSLAISTTTCCVPYPLAVPGPLPDLPTAGKAIVGGNISIMGNSGLSHLTSNISNNAALQAPLTIQLNGTLAFTTIGLSLPWFGIFSTSRVMAWAYKPDLQVFATQVAVDGAFQVQSTATGESMPVNVTGFVNLLSTSYPGPGFNGKYQLAGDLTLTPNPFSDTNDTASAGISRRRLAGADVAALSVPVQGAVAVREQRIVGTTGGAAGTSLIDPDGSVVVEGDVPASLVAPWLGMSCTAEACDGAFAYDDASVPLAHTWPWKSVFNVDALIGGLIGGLVFCGFVTVAVVVVIRRRRTARYRQQPNTDGYVADSAGLMAGV